MIRQPANPVTPAERRVIGVMRETGPAYKWVPATQAPGNYTWFVAPKFDENGKFLDGQPATRMIHSLILKGYINDGGNEAVLTEKAEQVE